MASFVRPMMLLVGLFVLVALTSKAHAADCKWTNWSQWYPCPKDCYPGLTERRRSISKPAESGGQPCEGRSWETKICKPKKDCFERKLCAIAENEGRTRKKYIYDGDKESYMGSWNDDIGYLQFEKGCILTAYENMHYKGEAVVLYQKREPEWKDRYCIELLGSRRIWVNWLFARYPIRNDGWIYRYWANDISSYKCKCYPPEIEGC